MNQTDQATLALATAAHLACRRMASLDTASRNAALSAISRGLGQAESAIFQANELDMQRSTAEGLAPPLLKRLQFGPAKLAEVRAGIESVFALPDPLNRVLNSRRLETGLDLYQTTCPIGLIAMIFESRPDALVQIAALAVKSGNCLILKGGSEARESNRILASTILQSGIAAGLPEHWLALIESRAEVTELLQLHGIIDLIIPRGSNEFVQYIMRNSLIPVMGHADGICHVYVDASAEASLAERLVVDSKTQYVAVCNAAEILLIHRDAADRLLPGLARALAAKAVALHADSRSRAILEPAGILAETATEADWDSEYLDYIMAIKIVDSLDQAIEHINAHGSHHTDAIVTADPASARRFMQEVDSAGVFWNASTRFADGFKYGLGAEVGISTGKLHARGPVGLEGLVTYKYKLFGQGQTVADFGPDGGHSFVHQNLGRQQEPWA